MGGLLACTFQPARPLPLSVAAFRPLPASQDPSTVAAKLEEKREHRSLTPTVVALCSHHTCPPTSWWGPEQMNMAKDKGQAGRVTMKEPTGHQEGWGGT